MSLEACTLVNPEVGSANLCSGVVEYASGYAYNVTLWTAALFTALFALVAIAHLGQAIRGRRWFMLGTVFICCLTELLGWSARLWSAISTKWSPENGGQWTSAETAFLMQISTLIFAPAFLAAGWYIMLGKLIGLLGPQYCRFNPVTYAIVFLLGDAASLVTQAVGGGLAAGSETEADARMGANIMLGGVCAQMFVTVLYCLLLAETLVRYSRNKPVAPFRFRRTKSQNNVLRGTVDAATERKAKTLVGAMVFSTTLIFIRSIYRVAELSEGWSGPIISNEMLFCVLDATMVFFAVLVFNFIHPVWFLPRGETAAFSTRPSSSDHAVPGEHMVRRSSSQTVVGEPVKNDKETV